MAMGDKPAPVNRIHLFLLVSGLAVLAWSAYRPRGYAVWAADVAPAVVGGVILIATYRRFRLTTLTYVLVWWFSLILIVGGHYTYAEVPIGNWVKEALELKRNHYDRMGHLFQGFVPAIVARELLIRTSPLRPGKWMFFLVLAACLGISALYELVEWWSALVLGAENAAEFQATPGTPNGTGASPAAERSSPSYHWGGITRARSND